MQRLLESFSGLKYYSMNLILLLLLCTPTFAGSEEVHYGTDQWDSDIFGNHRAVVKVTEKTDVALAHIPWRRRDTHPEKKNIIVVDASTGTKVKNRIVININREFGDIIFQPLTSPGIYYIYYLTSIAKGSKHYPKVTYQEPELTAENTWLDRNGITQEKEEIKNLQEFTKAKLIEIQAIDKFNSFYPMEIIATSDEVHELMARHPKEKYLLFTENRKNPIRMSHDLPQKWINDGISNKFKGNASRGEFYAFQVAVYAARENVRNIEADFSDLIGEDGKTRIPSSAVTCFNLKGVDWTGKVFKKSVKVNKGEIQPLWFGVQIPENIIAQTYKGKITIAPDEMEKQEVSIDLSVSEKLLADAGDSQPWRHSRLCWLDSRIASDDGIVPPFTPVEQKGNTVSCLGRDIILGKTGFPESIKSKFSYEMTGIVGKGREILASPIQLVTQNRSGQSLKWAAGETRITKKTEGVVAWESSSKSGPLTMNCKAQMEFDGYLEFCVTITSSKDIRLSDIRLEIPLHKDVAKYMMGMGFKGGLRPERYNWKWDVKKNQDSVWVGDVNAGLQVSLRDLNYARPLNTNFYLSKPLNMPDSWHNRGKGGVRLEETGNGLFLITAYSGERLISAGSKLHFNFNLLLTPFKPLDTVKQWKTRFYHSFKTLDEIAVTGANTINVHHATQINPYINYPFLRPDAMKNYIDEAHKRNFKIKIYYTVRELSNRAPEIFALRSLGDEILSYGPGGGFSWLQEHLEPNYIAGWLVPKLKDAAVINTGVSRWHNYYLEGLNWLVKNVGIDGLYIDDVAFDRTVMKRVRKILDRNRNGALIDLHSANQFNVRDGFANSANLYLEHFPYIDRLWFGEYFDYNAMPDYWLIEVSGIPFGLMGEMLQDGGNPWRGMIFGMTSRLPWAGDPRPIWKMWDKFGILNSRMIGYWVPDCPVKTDSSDILATVYMKKTKSLVSIASWAEEETNCKLSIDWKRLGINPEKAAITAPCIENFQEQTVFKPSEVIPIKPGRGWLLIIEEKE